MKPFTGRAKAYIATVSVIGWVVLGFSVMHWQMTDVWRTLCYVLLAVLASSLKVRLPGVTGTMSVIFLFVLIGNIELSFGETVLLASLATVAQIFWNPSVRPKPIQVIFNIASMAMASAMSWQTFHWSIQNVKNLPVALALSTTVFFISNTGVISGVLALTERKSLQKLWYECYFWSFPYYMIGAAIAGLLSAANHAVGWQMTLLVLPVIYWIYRSYRLYLGRLEAEKRHVEEMASLHLRTIEALALAIEAKDHTTHDHLQRVRVYAVALGEELNLAEDELEALRAASLLHDIGKLAVPEHIISKPGKLTPEEFEKMKIHPVVGAEILERVKFPYPVVPIVRAHHEKWDGSGYPLGLKGDEIPVGARILSAVDCLDALASDRQYRRALPLDEAMASVVADSGKAFDPKVVRALEENYIRMERMARSRASSEPAVVFPETFAKDAKPAVGFERGTMARGDGMEFLSSIAAARQEGQMLFELTHDLGNSLSLSETLSLVGGRLKKLVPHDSIAVYVLKEGKLVTEHVSGDDFRLFAGLEIPLGQGLSGWVAQNRKPIINGNPSVEPGYLNDPTKFTTLRSALAVPLEGVSGVVGVLALYRAERDAFTADHLRVLLAISSKVALAIDNALKYRIAEDSATTDYLTGLPNARSLFLQLDRELARCKRTATPLAVFVCDLNGFKQVNDRFGHLEGNRVLRLFGEKLKVGCREYDYVARMGGDEFVILAPGMTASASGETITRMAQVAVDVGREVTGQDILSLSVGRAFFPTDGSDAEQLLATADRNMYSAKQEHYAARQHGNEIVAARASTAVN
jgi:diguanylate cyclase (GGDEF)-like protein/putative nucleotidyltransferase with HDIG domain